MQPREKIIVEASGKPGTHGFQYYGERDGVAPAGRPGANGRSSCAATDGEHGRDIHIRLCPPITPSTVIVKGMNAWKNTIWEVTNDQFLLLDCKGGDAGDGGRGEDGQQGGSGARGRNATKYRDAEHGGMGARGGDGGYGSNGANGGKAGSVFIEVEEKDTDLLLPVFWDIRGGKGGASGTHGDPGDGGIGGDGGNGITWTERYGDHTVHKSRPRGAPGPQGAPGKRPGNYLSGGMGGANGSSQITVFREDGTQATYPAAFSLKVVGFDISDENGDNINEPGEHLLVTNIKVENVGGMPSPKFADIKLLIHGTHWLDPVMSESVYLPKDIKPGETVTVPGVLRAFILQERSTRAPGQLLHACDDVQLIATAVRLGRTLPDFSGSTNIVIRYPLELDRPKYLDCVEKGDEVTFSWVLRNVSTKPYGVHAVLNRDAGTILSDPGLIFDFADAEASGQHKMVDLLEQLDPGCEVPISQTFRVSDRAFPYTEAHLKLELMLSEPGRDRMQHSQLKTDHEEHPHLRSVVWYGVRMQIAGTYVLNPNASFLMLVNAYTVNNVIHQNMKFIQNELGLGAKRGFDIFNVSLNGNLISPVTGGNVLEDYVGKSIILFTNAFPYFSRGTRTIFDLLDPHLVGRLARAGTNFLLVGPKDSREKAVEWSSMLKFLRYNPTTDSEDDGSTHTGTMKELHKSLYDQGAPEFINTLPRHTFPSKKGLFSGSEASLDKNAKSTAKKMTQTFPLRRFTVHGDAEVNNSTSPGRVEVYEGLPMASKIRCSLEDFDPNSDVIADFNKFSIVSCLPFSMRVEMMWNIMRTGGTVNGICNSELYRLKSIGPDNGVMVTVNEQRQVDEKICQAVFLSVEHDLIQELSLFTSKVPWPDVLPGAASLKQLPLLNQFFDISCAANSPLSFTEGTNNLSQILGSLDAALAPVGFWQGVGRTVGFGWGSRKANLVPQLNKRRKDVLAASFTPDAAAQLQTSTATQSKLIAARLKAAGSTRKGMEDLAQTRIKSFVTDGSGTAYIDLPHHHPTTRGTELLPRGAPRAKIAEWQQFMSKINEDCTAAQAIRDNMVTRE